MEKTLREILERHFGKSDAKITPMGGGFYGRVFLAEPMGVVLKMYLFKGIAENEARQLAILRAHATLPMPEVYFTDCASEYEALAMEYLPGVNAGNIDAKCLAPIVRGRIGEQIIENLLAYHSAVNPRGFGEIGGERFAGDWREVYRPIAEKTLPKARALCAAGSLPGDVLSAMETACARFGEIFCLPITKARLIHGDYNAWNILLDGKMERAAAAIDPFGCRWADSEYDLYQLDNANGRDYGLLDLYEKNCEMSANFGLKRRFYEVFTEVNHFFDAGVDPVKSGIPAQAAALQRAMEESL